MHATHIYWASTPYCLGFPLHCIYSQLGARHTVLNKIGSLQLWDSGPLPEDLGPPHCHRWWWHHITQDICVMLRSSNSTFTPLSVEPHNNLLSDLARVTWLMKRGRWIQMWVALIWPGVIQGHTAASEWLWSLRGRVTGRQSSLVSREWSLV